MKYSSAVLCTAFVVVALSLQGCSNNLVCEHGVNMACVATEAVLVKSGVECKSGDKNLGKAKSVGACMGKAMKGGNQFFVFGTGAKKGECWAEHTKNETCSEGFQKDAYDFYKTDVEDAMFVRGSSECKSNDHYLGKQPSVTACTLAVLGHGGAFFCYSKESKKCYKEDAKSESCPEGFKDAPYDFYKVEGPRYDTQTLFSVGELRISQSPGGVSSIAVVLAIVATAMIMTSLVVLRRRRGASRETDEVRALMVHENGLEPDQVE